MYNTSATNELINLMSDEIRYEIDDGVMKSLILLNNSQLRTLTNPAYFHSSRPGNQMYVNVKSDNSDSVWITFGEYCEYLKPKVTDEEYFKFLLEYSE